MRALFDPEDGSVTFPECLGIIDTSREKVNFESTSCNIGKSLRMKRYDNRVGVKMLIVIRRDEDEDTLYEKDGETVADISKLDYEVI